MSGFAFLVIGIFLSMLVIPAAIRAAPFLGMVDEPDPRKVHAKPIPRIGGLGIAVGALLPLAVLAPYDNLLLSFLLASLILVFFGAWDDASELSHWIKFAGQFVAVSLVVFFGDLWVSRFPFMGGDTLPASIGRPFTIVAMVGVINAINHSDGLDGLAGGESLLGLIVMGFLAYLADDALGVYICCAVAGGILGFLRFNTHPARIFMGDAGSQFLGFSMGFLVVYLTQIGHPALSPALPLLLVGLPIADINAVFYLRASGGMNWFKATRNHIHHRLLDLGFQHYETVVIIYSIQALLVGSAVILRYQSDWIVILVYFLVVGALFVGLTTAERRNVSVAVPENKRAMGRLIGSLRRATRLRVWSEYAVIYGLSGLLLLGAIAISVVDAVVASLSAALLIICLIGFLFWSWRTDSIGFRYATQALAILIVYVTAQTPPEGGILAVAASTPLYLAFGFILALAIRLTSERVFKTTATDYLILFGLITVGIFGREQLEVRQISIIVVHSVIAIYASEFACRAVASRVSGLTVAVLGGLAIIAIKGVF